MRVEDGKVIPIFDKYASNPALPEHVELRPKNEIRLASEVFNLNTFEPYNTLLLHAKLEGVNAVNEKLLGSGWSEKPSWPSIEEKLPALHDVTGKNVVVLVQSPRGRATLGLALFQVGAWKLVSGCKRKAGDLRKDMLLFKNINI